METVQLAEFHRSRPNVDDKSVVFIPAARRHRRRWLEGEWRCPALKLQRPQNSCMQRNQDCWPCFHDRMRPLHENACTHIGARGTYLSRPRVRVNSPLPSLRLLKIFYLAIFFFIFFRNPHGNLNYISPRVIIRAKIFERWWGILIFIKYFN